MQRFTTVVLYALHFSLCPCDRPAVHLGCTDRFVIVLTSGQHAALPVCLLYGNKPFQFALVLFQQLLL